MQYVGTIGLSETMSARRNAKGLGAPSLGGNTLTSSRKEMLRVAPRDVPECVGDGARRTQKVTKLSRVGSIDVASTRAP